MLLNLYGIQEKQLCAPVGFILEGNGSMYRNFNLPSLPLLYLKIPQLKTYNIAGFPGSFRRPKQNTGAFLNLWLGDSLCTSGAAVATDFQLHMVP